MKVPDGSRLSGLTFDRNSRTTIGDQIYQQVQKDNKEPKITATDFSTSVGNSIYELIKEDNDPAYRYRSVNRLDMMAAKSLHMSERGSRTDRSLATPGTRILLDKMNRKLDHGWSKQAYDVKAMIKNRGKPQSQISDMPRYKIPVLGRKGRNTLAAD